MYMLYQVSKQKPKSLNLGKSFETKWSTWLIQAQIKPFQVTKKIKETR